jgi:methylenetetrahydrofolate--tRNA-(uracil-5-)-methyltransferase
MKFQPANITFDLLPPLEKKIRDRQERHKMQCQLALEELASWLENPEARMRNVEVSRAS